MDWHRSSSLQLVINDLNDIAADAYRHRIRPRSKKGGNGVYDATNGGFVYLLPSRCETNRRARFEITQISADAIAIKAVSVEDSTCTLCAVVDRRGRLTNLVFSEQAPVQPAFTRAEEELLEREKEPLRLVSPAFSQAGGELLRREKEPLHLIQPVNHIRKVYEDL